MKILILETAFNHHALPLRKVYYKITIICYELKELVNGVSVVIRYPKLFQNTPLQLFQEFPRVQNDFVV